LQPGDTLVVWKLDRLGRSLRDLITMLDDFKKQGIKFKSLTEAIDTETPTGRAMWQMIGVLAELERSLISERTRAGVKAAKDRGVKFGRSIWLEIEFDEHVPFFHAVVVFDEDASLTCAFATSGPRAFCHTPLRSPLCSQ
jgi:DNA invertase Pin-like site-specific DNA recombinase